MTAPNIAIVGATGLVGELLLRLLEERNYPVGEMRPLASSRSVGSTVMFRGASIPVQEATLNSFAKIDLVFFAATGTLSRTLAPAAVAAGATVIDKSNTWRMDPRVPLVVPEINPECISSQPGIIACPNCSTIGFVMALQAIHQLAELKSVVVTTFQAASGTGRDGVDELAAGIAGRASGNGDQNSDASKPGSRVFPRLLAGNVVPQCDEFLDNAYTGEEMKLLHEARKIMALPDLQVSMTCVRVPVETGHCASILAETKHVMDLARVYQALHAQPGLRVLGSKQQPDYPIPDDVANTDDVLIGRVRMDLHNSKRLWLWQAANNLRKGAATNAIQIAEAWLISLSS